MCLDKGIQRLDLCLLVGRVNPLSLLATLVLTIAAFSGLGLLSATAIVLLKKGDPIELLIGSTSSLLGGAFFPVVVMPEWLQGLAKGGAQDLTGAVLRSSFSCHLTP